MIANSTTIATGRGRVDGSTFSLQPGGFVFKRRIRPRNQATTKQTQNRQLFASYMRYFATGLPGGVQSEWIYYGQNTTFVSSRQKNFFFCNGGAVYVQARYLADRFATGDSPDNSPPYAGNPAFWQNFSPYYDSGQFKFDAAYPAALPTGDDWVYLYCGSPRFNPVSWQRAKLEPCSAIQPTWSNIGDPTNLYFPDVYAASRLSGDVVPIGVYSTLSSATTGCNFFGWVMIP